MTTVGERAGRFAAAPVEQGSDPVRLLPQKTTAPKKGAFCVLVAEREGFEPSKGF